MLHAQSPDSDNLTPQPSPSFKLNKYTTSREPWPFYHVVETPEIPRLPSSNLITRAHVPMLDLPVYTPVVLLVSLT